MSRNRLRLIIFYLTLFVIALIYLSTTLIQYPLFPLRFDSPDWASAWLKMSVVDYYAATLCLSGIVVSSEASLFWGLIWVLAFCVVGSPACCLWVVLWLCRGGGSLKLEWTRDEVLREG
eukprot:GHVN01017298.1.p1 GENE.GHVN01017298.1~~GHVN01017298.1.p1  ORF type:complete len:119 (-),score=14.58 GHVN01017298.1:117-473(-)